MLNFASGGEGNGGEGKDGEVYRGGGGGLNNEAGEVVVERGKESRNKLSIAKNGLIDDGDLSNRDSLLAGYLPLAIHICTTDMIENEVQAIATIPNRDRPHPSMHFPSRISTKNARGNEKHHLATICTSINPNGAINSMYKGPTREEANGSFTKAPA